MSDEEELRELRRTIGQFNQVVCDRCGYRWRANLSSASYEVDCASCGHTVEVESRIQLVESLLDSQLSVRTQAWRTAQEVDLTSLRKPAKGKVDRVYADLRDWNGVATLRAEPMIESATHNLLVSKSGVVFLHLGTEEDLPDAP